MSKKPLLEENITRRMMELSGQEHLAESFLSKLKEVKTDEQSRAPEGTNRLDEEETDEEEVEASEVEMEEPEAEMEPPEAEEEMGEASVEGLVSAIADAIEQHTGVEVDVEGGDAEDDMDMGMEDDADMDMDDMDMESDEEMAMDDEEELMEDASQESARGMPKPGSSDHIEHGKMPGVTDSSDSVEHSHSDHKMKDQPTTSKSLQERRRRAKQKQARELAERVYKRVVRKLQEQKKKEIRKQKIQEAKKRIAERRKSRKQ